MKFDLHSHSDYSDGTSTPGDVVRLAVKSGVSLLSLTDHDTVSGLPEAEAEAKALGIRFLPGIEINTAEPDQIHILGYGIDPKSAALLKKLEELRDIRRRRVGLMLERLRDLKIEIDFDDVVGVSKETLGRPHIADALRKKGYVRTRQEAFQKYLMLGRPGYVEPMGLDIRQSIDTIRAAGGLASLAHPGFVKRALDLAKWVEWGLGGIEVYYPSHTGNYTRKLIELAKPYGLLLTGGSDHHGPRTERDKLGLVQPSQEDYDEVVQTFFKA